jgi:adenylosuccinate synthase
MKADVVIGSAFGDEGKGTMVDYLSSQYDNALVIRFNSGAQAGHTVTTPDGKRHVFSHFGSGSFVGAKTFLSEHFVSNPILFFKELALLNKLGVDPIVYVHQDSMITTPYDMMINQMVEKRRGSVRHGSCGVGFNETIERNLRNDSLSLRVKDLWDEDWITEVVNRIRSLYSPNRLGELGFFDEYTNNHNLFSSDDIFENFLLDLKAFRSRVIVRDMKLSNFDGVIFEGAQGLLLDQNHKWFPHVTRSNTGLQNVVHLANKYGIEELNVNYMTRSYLTRHGAGPMPFELDEKPYSGIVDLTNIPNDWQGSLRFSWFNNDLLKESISKDMDYARNTFNGIVNSRLVVTCMDQLDDNVGFVTNGKVRQMSNDEFVAWVKARPNSKMNFGPTRNTIV